MSIRDDKTVEVQTPLQRTSRIVGYLVMLLLVAAVAAAAAIALVPGLRQRVLGVGGRPIKVAISSTPQGADVFVDEQPAGATPTEVELAPGEHLVRIVRKDYKPWRQTIDPAKVASLSPTLEPLALGTLVVESQPDRASVLLDGDYRGVTPITIRHVEAGPHTLRIAREPMYKATTQQIELKAGETRRIEVQLESGLEALYEGRIKENPGALTNYTELLHLHVINNQADKAIATLTRGLKALETAEASPDDLGRFFNEIALVHKGRAGALDEATQKQLLDAVAMLFGKIAAAHPDEPERYREIVSLLGQAGQWEAIVKVCSEADAESENKGIVATNVAKLYLGWGEANCAIMLLQRAVQFRPDDFEVRYSLGSAYHRSDRNDEALAEYQAAEKLAANASAYYVGKLHYDIARLLAAKGDIDGACARFEKALELKVSPYYACQWRYRYADLLLEHGRKDKAIEQYKAIVSQTPDSKLGIAARKALLRLGDQKTP